MTPPDPAPYLSAVSYEAALALAGWTRIGGGAGGGVYHRQGDPQVIKVSDGDDCYLAFADHVQGNPRPCLPILQVVHRGQGWAVTHIEHLAPIMSANATAVAAWWTAYVNAVRAGAQPPDPQQWSATADALRPIASAHRCGFDVKEENVMERPATGQVVFVDLLF